MRFKFFEWTKELCKWHRPIEFQVDDKVFLRVSPTRALKRFLKKGKLV